LLNRLAICFQSIFKCKAQFGLEVLDTKVEEEEDDDDDDEILKLDCF
jgi:hypothetical protein